MAKNPNSITRKNILPYRGCEKLYLDSITADVFFVLNPDGGDKVKIPAHKSILAMNSTVFHSMFYGPYKQKGDILIVNSSPEILKEFLQFFYLSKVKLTIDNKTQVLHFADEFMLNDCKNAYTDLSKLTLTTDNMCYGYGMAILFEQDDLETFCEQKISENPAEIFKSSSFLACEPNLLGRILQLDSLNCDESVVFNGCMAWAKAACIRKGLDERNMLNLRTQLDELFYEIRFGDMTTEQFYACRGPYDGLFSIQELNDIIGMITTNDFEPEKFNRNPRKSKQTQIKAHNETVLLMCNRIDLNASYTDECYSQSESTYSSAVFITNYSLLLTKLYFSDFSSRRSDEISKLFAQIAINAISQNNSVTELYSTKIEVNQQEETIVEIPKSIIIKPSIKYEILFKLLEKSGNCELPKDFKSLLAHKEEVEIDEDVIVKFLDFNRIDRTLSNTKNAKKKFGVLTKIFFLKSNPMT